ncbi:hypothetical protein KWI83_23850 [Streptomyces sp. TRM70350]|nr:hypothetical protein [Streptomyces sp. TRM70350]
MAAPRARRRPRPGRPPCGRAGLTQYDPWTSSYVDRGTDRPAPRKFLNVGQTRVAPDHVLTDPETAAVPEPPQARPVDRTTTYIAPVTVPPPRRGDRLPQRPDKPLAPLTVFDLPFGGVGGESGTGSHHGRRSIETFSHRKAVLDKPLS